MKNQYTVSTSPAPPDTVDYLSVIDLLGQLAAVGWGALAGARYRGARATLHALVMLGVTTQPVEVTQVRIAATAGLSVRWVQICMRTLEHLGVIAWTRGGMVAGQPTASLVRIDTARLAELGRLTQGWHP